MPSLVRSQRLFRVRQRALAGVTDNRRARAPTVVLSTRQSRQRLVTVRVPLRGGRLRWVTLVRLVLRCDCALLNSIVNLVTV